MSNVYRQKCLFLSAIDTYYDHQGKRIVKSRVNVFLFCASIVMGLLGVKKKLIQEKQARIQKLKAMQEYSRKIISTALLSKQGIE